MRRLVLLATLLVGAEWRTALWTWLVLPGPEGDAFQIQCFQCEEMKLDCSAPEHVVNCTVNVQDMCQKEVLVRADGIHYRKSCASSGACLIASSGYQQFCTGRLNSVCISCCNTPLCNGPRRRRPIPSAVAASSAQMTTQMLLPLAFYVMPRLQM